jgi:hypothetical protein
MRQRRKRSAAITLVLAGTLSGCGEPLPQRDVYTSLANCQRDWQAADQCLPATGGQHSRSWYYGPDYYGNSYSSGSPKPSPSAIEAFHSGRGSTARGGFGSTSRSFSSAS